MVDSAAPGWYAVREGGQRWWDGEAWTDDPPPEAAATRLSDKEVARQLRQIRAQDRDRGVWAEEERRRQAKEAEHFWESPPRQARAAYQRGDGFFQTQIELTRLAGAPSQLGSYGNELRRTDGRPDVLGQIEDEGWRLEHAGFVFVETGATSTNRLLSTGQGIVTRGVVEGIYLFRRVERPSTPNESAGSAPS